MLQNIRSWTEGWLAWAIVILISIPFALWGINEYFGGGGDVTVANVDGTEISQRELEQAYQRQRPRLQAVLGDRLDERLLRQQVLQEMVNQLVLVQAASDTGLRVGDAQLANEIHAMPAFQGGAGFDRKVYEDALRTQGLAPRPFEEQLRQSLTIDQLQQGIRRTAIVTPQERDRLARLRDQAREVAYLIVPVARFLPQTTITDADVQQYYDSHQAEFVVPEQVSVDYIELKLDDLAAAAPPADEPMLRRLYEEHQGDFTVPEERRAAHILVAVGSDAPAAEIDAARARAETLMQRAQQGESFEVLAQESSEDPGSAKQGGDLGYFGRGVMDSAFEDAVYAMTPGDLRLVQTPFGFHVIKLIDIKAAQVKPFEEVREQLAQEERRRQVEGVFLDKGETLANLAYEHPDTLQPAAEALGLPINTTPLFSRDGAAADGLASNPKIRETAFAEDVLRAGSNSEPVEVTATHLVVLRVKEHRPSEPRPLAEVRPQIEQQLRFERAREQARELGQRIVERLKSGADASGVAAEHELKWEPAVKVKRDDQQLNSAIVAAAFQVPRSAGASPRIGEAAFPSGDFVVVSVLGIEDGQPAAAAEAQDKPVAEATVQAFGARELQSVVEGFRERADIAVYPEKL